jgi:hypothetical protein
MFVLVILIWLVPDRRIVDLFSGASGSSRAGTE